MEELKNLGNALKSEVLGVKLIKTEEDTQLPSPNRHERRKMQRAKRRARKKRRKR
jgi:hypothetical protein